MMIVGWNATTQHDTIYGLIGPMLAHFHFCTNQGSEAHLDGVLTCGQMEEALPKGLIQMDQSAHIRIYWCAHSADGSVS